MIVTSTPREISYFVPDVTTSLLTYDSLRFWRSRDGKAGLYEAATDATAGPATLEGTHAEPHQLNGKTLSLMINGTTQVDILFSDADPVTTAQVITAISGETALITPTDVGGALHLETVATGSSASIEVLESDAAPYLGFDTSAAAVGLDADVSLVADTYEYLYTDQNSDSDFWYRVEFFNSSTNQTSGLGTAFQVGPVGAPASSRIWAYIQLIDLSGNPIEGRRVTLANAFLPNTVVSGSNRWGSFRHYATLTTDSDGYAQIRVLRGMQVDVVVDGTDFIRRLSIPSTGDSVNLLDPDLVAEDEFGIQEPVIDFAIRTS